jgi:hypothetical protein
MASVQRLLSRRVLPEQGMRPARALLLQTAHNEAAPQSLDPALRQLPGTTGPCGAHKLEPQQGSALPRHTSPTLTWLDAHCSGSLSAHT